MQGKHLVERVRKAKKDFGSNPPNKFGGAAAIEILRAALARKKILTSQRDVFVRGVPLEVDLIVPQVGERPSLHLVFTPGQVAVALEVKKGGTFGKPSLKKIRHDFAKLRRSGICCAYITFEERYSYRWKATEKNIGAPCFTLAWHKYTDGPLEPTGDWERFVAFLRKAIATKQP